MSCLRDISTLPVVTSTGIALVGAAISVLSLLLAARLAWVTKFGPPRLIGMISCLVLYTFKNSEGTGGERFFVPMLWLTNTGARPMLVQDIRLIIKLPAKDKVVLYPLHTVPTEAFESPIGFSDFEELRSGRAPFSGFAILPSERWVNNLAFPITAEEFELLKLGGAATIEVRKIGTTKFKSVLTQSVHFAQAKFEWLRWAGIGGSSVDYFYAEQGPSRGKKDA
jgi:hypothetical protein